MILTPYLIGLAIGFAAGWSWCCVAWQRMLGLNRWAEKP